MKPWLLKMTAICAISVGILALPADGQILKALKIARNNQPPPFAFDAHKAPPAPDYGQPKNWATLAEVRDAADATPAGVSGIDQTRAPVAVFYIYPTVLMSREVWNADVRDTALNAKIDSTAVRNQASVFNGCCAIYTPRYRQMTLGGYIKWSDNSVKASELAYSDVARAFRYFLANFSRDRPIIIAGHSQGARLGRLLIEREVDGKPLAKRLVAAYLIGHWIEADWFKGLKDVRPCIRADDLNCVVTWSTYEEGRNAALQRRNIGVQSKYKPEQIKRDYAGINPLSWTTDGVIVPASRNPGAWQFGPGVSSEAAQAGLVSARYRDGAVYVSKPGKQYAELMIPFGNYHNVDYNLFYMSLRKNAEVRSAAWLRREGL